MVVKIISGLSRLPMAKFIDAFGRTHGLLVSTALMILGLFIQASARSIAATGAAQILYGIGWNSLDYVFTVLIADLTTLKNRSRSSLRYHPNHKIIMHPKNMFKAAIP